MNFWDFRHAFGVALIFLGLPLSWLVRDFFGYYNNQIFSGIFLSLGLLLIVNFKNLFITTAHGKSFLIFTPLLFILPAMIACNNAGIMIFLIFSVFFCLVCSTLSIKQILLLPQAFVTVGFLTCSSVIIFLLASGYEFNNRRLTLGETTSPGFLGYVAALTFSSSIFFLTCQTYRQKKWFSLLAKWNLFLGPFLMLSTLSRSQYIGISLVGCFFLTRLLLFFESNPRVWNKNYRFSPSIADNKRKSGDDNLWGKFLIAGILVLTLQDILASLLTSVLPKFTSYFNQIVGMISRGSETYTGNAASDPAALIRYNNIQYALDNLSDVGHGFMSKWLDCPVLQSYYDGGLLGFLIFTSVTLFIPGYFILRFLFSRTLHPIHIFCSYLYLTFSPMLFLHSYPYNYILWINIIPFYSFVCIQNFYGTKNT